MKGDVIIGLGLQCFDEERYGTIRQTSLQSNISNEVVVIVDSQSIVELTDHRFIGNAFNILNSNSIYTVCVILSFVNTTAISSYPP